MAMQTWIVCGAVVCLTGAAFYWRWQVTPLTAMPPSPPRVIVSACGDAAVRHDGVRFVTSIARFHDELFAYLMLQHYRSAPPIPEGTLHLVYKGNERQPEYEILIEFSDDFIGSTRAAAELSARQGNTFELVALPAETAANFQKQTRLFDSAYNLPVRRKMEELPPAELRALIRRFVRFKSATDPRIRSRLESMPSHLSSGEADQLAGDIIAVAAFYGLPLELILGIGAMENNYMNVRGDLEHSIWKRRPAKDDIVLERRKGRVRVLNDSAGVWQITRETLRYAHRLYLKDKRDYTRLPEHLRPRDTLSVTEVEPAVLATYAGLILRDLFDRFQGNVALAVGAYNGGPRNPNLKYEQGVRAAAGHARGVLERAAALNGESVVNRSWISARE